MAVEGLRLPVLCVFLSALAMLGSAAPSAPAPAVDCSTLVLSMADCLSFVSAGSTTKKPEGTCCSGLKTVLKTGAQCLCEAFKNSAQLGVTLNISKALTLPSACHVSAPSVSNCGLSVPAGAPALSPSNVALAPSTDGGAPSSGSGTDEVATAPAPASSSGSSSLAASVVLVVMAAVSCTLF